MFWPRQPSVHSPLFVIRFLTRKRTAVQARQVEAFILNGVQKQKILAPRWRAMTGKRLLRLEHGQRLGAAAKGNDRRGLERDHAGGGGGGSGGVPLSGLEEEGSDTSSSSGGSDRAG